MATPLETSKISRHVNLLFYMYLIIIVFLQNKIKNKISKENCYRKNNLQHNLFTMPKYSSLRHSMIHHSDRHITHLGDLDISFVLLKISSNFFFYI